MQRCACMLGRADQFNFALVQALLQALTAGRINVGKEIDGNQAFSIQDLEMLDDANISWVSYYTCKGGRRAWSAIFIPQTFLVIPGPLVCTYHFAKDGKLGLKASNNVFIFQNCEGQTIFLQQQQQQQLPTTTTRTAECHCRPRRQ
jgi:hypothetical protein